MFLGPWRRNSSTTQHSVLDHLYIRLSKFICARFIMPSKYKDLFIMSGVVEGVSIAQVRSRLRYEIKKVMSHAYLEDLGRCHRKSYSV